jgi:hypothetical protein
MYESKSAWVGPDHGRKHKFLTCKYSIIFVILINIIPISVLFCSPSHDFIQYFILISQIVAIKVKTCFKISYGFDAEHQSAISICKPERWIKIVQNLYDWNGDELINLLSIFMDIFSSEQFGATIL